MEVLPSHSVLANGIHIGSTRRELVDAFEKAGLTLVQGEDESYQYVCNTEDCSYLILMNNYEEPKDEDIVTCISIQIIE